MGAEEFRNALQSTREIELTVTGRTSGRETSRPVWFVQEGGTLVEAYYPKRDVAVEVPLG